jgi:hypothetical protein
MAQWERKYGNGGVTSWTPVEDFASILMRFEPLEQHILSGYQAIDVPPAFRTAHAAFLADDTASLNPHLTREVVTFTAQGQQMPRAAK